MENNTALEVRRIEEQIIRLDGRPPIMLTKDLAEVYQVTSRQITQAVKRNPDRFPEDFVFRLTEEEVKKLQGGTQNEYRLSPLVTELPLAFTREGANMLSAVLRSKIAAERSIQIMRAFSAMEEHFLKARVDNLEEQIKKLKKQPPARIPEKGTRSLENRLAKFLDGREITGWKNIKNNFYHRYYMPPEEEKKLKAKTEIALRKIGWRA